MHALEGWFCLFRLIICRGMHRCVQAQRGKWSSIDGVTVFGWSGSALIGGSILDHHGFGVVFLLTAALQLFACLAFAGPLLFMIPLFESACDCECVEGEQADAEAASDNSSGEARNTADATGGAPVSTSVRQPQQQHRQARCQCCGCCISASTQCAARGTSQACCKRCHHASKLRRSDSVDSALEAMARSMDDERGVLAPQPVPQAVEARSSHDSARRRSGNG